MEDKKESYNNLYPHFHTIKETMRDRGEKYRHYRKMWRRTAEEHIITPFPLHLDIEVTSHCNLNCPMCSRTHLVRKGCWENAHMSFDMFKIIIDEGAASGLCAVNLNNLGESLLNQELPRMIRYAKDSGIIDIMIHTNGTVLNETLSEALIHSGLDTVIFSMDSVSKEIYEQIRVGANFDTVVGNIRRFAHLKRELGYGTPIIRINMVKMKANLDEVGKAEGFWGNDADCITYVDYRNQDGLDMEDRYVVKREQNLQYICPSLWQRMTINVNGEVSACCRDSAKKLILGKLDGNCTLKDIWNGNVLKRVRELHLQGKAMQVNSCKGCDHLQGYQRPIDVE